MTSGSYPQLYNSGIRHAKNDIVVFFDDDCIAAPHFLERIRNAHIHYPDSVIQGMTESIPKGNIYAEVMGDHYRAFLEANKITEKTLRILEHYKRIYKSFHICCHEITVSFHHYTHEK